MVKRKLELSAPGTASIAAVPGPTGNKRVRVAKPQAAAAQFRANGLPKPADTRQPDRTAGPGTSLPGGAAPQVLTQDSAAFKNKEKVLLLSSRGITHRYRHLLLDLAQLLPHVKKDAKLDTKTERGVLNEVAELKGCTSVLFFETRKKKDLYIWLSKTPGGPSAKFHVTNVHTMAELKLSGNHLKGSRPALVFHSAFDEQPHTQLFKEMLTQAFATPRRHPRAKPFFDHVISFTLADGRIWLRNYQIVQAGTKQKATVDDTSLVEVGPRCCLNPVRIFAGSFGGPVLYENPSYVSPNKVRAALKRARAGMYSSKVQARASRRSHLAQHPEPVDELTNVWK